MLAITLLSLYWILLTVNVVTARGARWERGAADTKARFSPRRANQTASLSERSIRLTERGSATLVWLAKNPRPGTRKSRAKLVEVSRGRVFRGLRLAGVYFPFLCLHHYEGAWNSNTGNGYWGGLQFDSGFFHTYGSEYVYLWGTPDRWPIWSQLVAGYRAYHGYHGYGARGYSPWGTRGLCGL